MNADLLSIGSTARYVMISNPSAIDITTQGIGVTWDMSNLLSEDEEIQLVYKDPADTPYASSFPTANYVELYTYNDYYQYFHRTEQSLDLVGVFGQVAIIYFGSTTAISNSR